MLKFRIYYGVWDQGNGDYRYWTFEGRGFEDAVKAPTDGVQVIIQEAPEKAGRERNYDILCNKDYYIWRPDQGWIAVDRAGYETYEREVGFPKYVIHGYGLRNQAYRECHARAVREGLGE